MHAKKIIEELKTFANSERKKTNEWFFKTGPGEYSEHDQFMGVRVPHTRQVAKKHFKNADFSTLDKLIQHPIHEVRHCGLIILVNQYNSGKQQAVFDYYLNNIYAVNNWDLVDTTTPQIIGDYLIHHPENLSLLSTYAQSNNLWKRRIAIVATFTFIKHNNFQPTLDIGKALLNDQHDLIHKAIGWMLREIYKKNQEVAKHFLRENYAQLPRTTLRYAIERMAENERQMYLKGSF